MNSFVRTNTIEYRFEKGKEWPEKWEIYEWLEETIGIKAVYVKCIQLDTIAGITYVTFNNEQYMNELYSKKNGTIKLVTSKGVTHEVIIRRCDEKRKVVRIFNFPIQKDNNLLIAFLKNYGDVETLINETESSGSNRFPGVETGIRRAVMVVRKHIPSFINVDGQRPSVSYEGQPKTCNVCDSDSHLRSDCPDLMKAKERFQRLREDFVEKQVQDSSISKPTQNGINHHLTFADLYRKPTQTLERRTKIKPRSSMFSKQVEKSDTVENQNPGVNPKPEEISKPTENQHSQVLIDIGNLQLPTQKTQDTAPNSVSSNQQNEEKNENILSENIKKSENEPEPMDATPGKNTRKTSKEEMDENNLPPKIFRLNLDNKLNE